MAPPQRWRRITSVDDGGNVSVERNRHFEPASSWEEAASMLAFEPLAPAHTEGFILRSLAVHVRDHRDRELPLVERSLEAHYGGFVLSESRRDADEAKRLALEVRYGGTPREALVAGREGRAYELGPEPPPDDVDGRSPAVVVWHDSGMLFLVASDTLAVETLLTIGASLYRRKRKR